MGLTQHPLEEDRLLVIASVELEDGLDAELSLWLDAELAVLADVGQLDHEDVLCDEALEVRASVLDELTLDAELGEERL